MQKMMLVLIAAAMCAVLAGCAKPVAKDWVATSGSRSDAIVKLSFQYNPELEIPETNELQALELAKKRCNSWGYANAEAFGGEMRQCTLVGPAPFGGVVCQFMLVTKEYQCTGRGDAATPSEQIKEESVKKK
ncbi:MAG: YecR-like lipofamily protein [Desulfobulbaceae bacterium]|nr:YecR-like lipofamily protein [Desulfobulbaceae bacterium]